MIDDLPSQLSSPHGLFADDCAIWIDGLNIPDLVTSVQSSLNSVVDWCRNWGFVISESKSVAMLFTRRRNFGSLSLNINGSPLTFVDNFKYLGVTFDTKLTYRNHVNAVVTKCSNQMNLMKLPTRTYWGAGKRSLLKIYRSIIRPVIEYGMTAYFFSTRTQKQKIEAIQNQALRICCGDMPGIPITSCRLPVMRCRCTFTISTYA